MKQLTLKQALNTPIGTKITANYDNYDHNFMDFNIKGGSPIKELIVQRS